MTLLIFLTSVSVEALTWDGSSAGSGSGGLSSTGFAVETRGVDLIGFRFSLIDSNNNECGKSIDVYTSSRSGLFNRYIFSTKHSKCWWIKNYTSNVNMTFAKASDTSYTYSQSILGFATSLPSISSNDDITSLKSDLNEWKNYDANINALLTKIGYSSVSNVNNMTGYAIIVEPIVTAKMYYAGSFKAFSMTVTELAAFSGSYYYGNYDKVPTRSDTTGSFTFISKYTNYYFANYLHNENSKCNWSAAPELTANASFRTIIVSGYGVGVIYGDNKVNTFTIKFNANGGTGTMTDQVIVYGVSTPIKKCTFTYENKNFAGYWRFWWVEGNKWVSYGATINGGTGYYYDEQAISETVVPGDTIIAYAQWKSNSYTIKFNANNGSGTMADQSCVYGVETKINKCLFTYPGYTFTGYWHFWWVEGNKWVSYGQTIDGITGYYIDEQTITGPVPAGDTIIAYAQWTPISLIVKFDSNGGIGIMPNQSIEYKTGENLDKFNFVRHGYVFVEWNSDPKGRGTSFTDEAYIESTDYILNNVNTLEMYAIWKPTVYSVAKTRFINEQYYPYLIELHKDENGNFAAKKVNGVLYYLDTSNNVTSYAVDASVGVKISINDDGSYTVKPLSKWLTNDNCKTLLSECFADKNVYQTWTFESAILKEIRLRIIKESFINNFYELYGNKCKK